MDSRCLSDTHVRGTMHGTSELRGLSLAIPFGPDVIRRRQTPTAKSHMQVTRTNDGPGLPMA